MRGYFDNRTTSRKVLVLALAYCFFFLLYVVMKSYVSIEYIQEEIDLLDEKMSPVALVQHNNPSGQKDISNDVNGTDKMDAVVENNNDTNKYGVNETKVDDDKLLESIHNTTSNNDTQKDETGANFHNEKNSSGTVSTSVSTSVSTNTSTNHTSESSPPKFAYAFLVAGCDPKDSNRYLGYLYNILIAKRILIEYGSSTDVIIMIRMHAYTKFNKLPWKHEYLLREMNIIVKYLPKPHVDNFYTAVMDKFTILNYTDYDRILFLDSDVIPLKNLDYVFHASIQTTFHSSDDDKEEGEEGDDNQKDDNQKDDEEEEDTTKEIKIDENLILAYKTEPANAGFFMLKPNRDDYVAVLDIISKYEHNEKNLVFNKTIGWGHIIQPPDAWETANGKKGTLWDYNAVESDQGLLYYWTKYVKQKVSILIGGKIERWSSNEEGESIMVESIAADDIFGEVLNYKLLPGNHGSIRHRPYSDFEHFTSKSKPWLVDNLKEFLVPADIKGIEVATNTRELWFHVLRKVSKEHDFNIDPENMELDDPKLGFFAGEKMIMSTKRERLREEDIEVRRR